ncbi:MAG: hypothetical protein IKT59_09125 [Bacteroidales bacterium]|nr:hypothetical protein [Bacteroidales bacterium]
MAYKKVSIPKNGDGAGSPAPKSSDIVIIDVEDIVTEPTRTLGDPNMTGNFELNESAEAVTIYGTPSTINLTEEYGGDPDARGVKQGVAFSHPGNSSEIKGFIEKYMNKGVVILVKECDGTAEGKVEAYGSKCNPLFLSVERTDSNEARKRTLTFKQELNDKFLPGTYSGEMPKVAAAAASQAEGA